MIDLGDELDGFTDDEPPRPQRALQPTPQPHPDGGSTMPLADLQAAGFDTEPWPPRIPHSSDWKIRRSGRDVPPTILARTWLPGDADASITDKDRPPWTIVTGDDRPTIHYVAVDDGGPIDE